MQRVEQGVTKVLVLGAGGQIARRAVDMLADEDVELTLFLRDASKLSDAPETARVVEGDVLDREQLDAALRGQDIVYANLAGDLDAQAERIVESMTTAGVQRLIFVTALGIYDEVTQRDEPFKGTEVSRQSVAALVVDILKSPDRWSRSNLGVNNPGTEGDKPAFL